MTAATFPTRDQIAEMTSLDELGTAYGAFLAATGYNHMSADELRIELMAQETADYAHINWLGDFIEAWEKAEG
ncbi:hypothetical protein DWF04_006065 [Cereibacter sphaeroides f. sp. denitrificans]|nr:hypothetical protein DWF04_06135 [Cereibacter sphaeroides f. sp. denitrificans]